MVNEGQGGRCTVRRAGLPILCLPVGSAASDCPDTHHMTTTTFSACGFRSSAQSAKAQLLAQRGRRHPSVHFWCPQLPPSPRAAMAMVSARHCPWPRATMARGGLVAGGYYASWVAQRAACPSVLLNPAVTRPDDLARHIGDQTSWHDQQEHFYFAPDSSDELRALDVRDQRPAARQMAIIAKGDEVLGLARDGGTLPAARLRLQRAATMA